MLALQSAPSGGAVTTHCGGGLESQKRKLLRRCEEGIRHSSAKNSKIANNLDYQEWSIQNTALERQMPSPYCVPNAVHFGKPIIQLFATPHWGNRRFSPSVTIASDYRARKTVFQSSRSPSWNALSSPCFAKQAQRQARKSAQAIRAFGASLGATCSVSPRQSSTFTIVLNRGFPVLLNDL